MNGRRIVVDANIAFRALSRGRNEALISIGDWMEAYRLCSPTDEKDTAYVALALHLDAKIWSEDEELKAGLRARGFDRFL